jgi:hypothetical protein
MTRHAVNRVARLDSKPLRKGRIEFYEDAPAEQPRGPGCRILHIYYQRPFENGGEVGGWWAVRLDSDHQSFVRGPFDTEHKAVSVAQEWAEQCGCRFIP